MMSIIQHTLSLRKTTKRSNAFDAHTRTRLARRRGQGQHLRNPQALRIHVPKYSSIYFGLKVVPLVRWGQSIYYLPVHGTLYVL